MSAELELVKGVYVNEKPMVISVSNCARCGKDHRDVEFKLFENPIPQDIDGYEWNYWAPCPTNGDPILMRIYGSED